MNMQQQLLEILEKARAEISATTTPHELQQLKAKLLGKKSPLSALLKQLGTLPAAQRPEFGQTINQAKNEVATLLKNQGQGIAKQEVAAKIAAQTIDVTLPGRAQFSGGAHPISQIRQTIEDLFLSIGFDLVEGPEIEDEFHNFTALNTPEHHPARAMHDTFYFDCGRLLRSHTSPVQIRAMQQQQPPFRLIAPGRVYRCDSDVTHTPMFHQVEGLAVDSNLTFSDLMSTLKGFLRSFFGQKLAVRFRPSYFPFTEPSAEVDVTCVKCQGKGCRICSHTGWLEVMGCGMVHPNVLQACNIDSNQYSGYAFGMGIERLAMLTYEVPDLRMFFENEQQFLATFNHPIAQI